MDFKKKWNYYYRRNKLSEYRNKKIDIDLIKNYKNYNIKSSRGRKYETVIKYSTIKIKYFSCCIKTKKKYENYNTVDEYIYHDKCRDKLNCLDRDINKEKFKMSIHYTKKNYLMI